MTLNEHIHLVETKLVISTKGILNLFGLPLEISDEPNIGGLNALANMYWIALVEIGKLQEKLRIKENDDHSNQ
jgi:hypothetical protein